MDDQREAGPQEAHGEMPAKIAKPDITVPHDFPQPFARKGVWLS